MNLKIRSKLIILASIPIAAIAAISIISMLNSTRISSQLEDILYQNAYKSSTSIFQADSELSEVLNDLRQITRSSIENNLLESYRIHLAEGEERIAALVADAENCLSNNREIWSSATDEETGLTIFGLFDAFNADFAAWQIPTNQLAATRVYLSDFDNTDTAVELKRMETYLTKALLLIDTIENQQIIRINSDKTTATSASIAIGVIAIALVFLLVFILIRQIMGPLKSAMNLVSALADGDLSQQLTLKAKDEIGQLVGEINASMLSFNQIISYIRQASFQVEGGARQVASTSVTLADGAANQASAIQELTASIEEISSQTELNASHAKEAQEYAELSKNKAEEGNSQMSVMLQAMDEINQSSANISKIIKVIDDIAFQTNILALNAAIEAAHAGQHGKGFSVVAEEVRNLSARSAEAAKETSEMIESSIHKISDGTGIAASTANSLKEITNNISHAAQLISQIAEASEQQSGGIHQINQGINQISGVIQDISATSEESSAASEQLLGQAEALKSEVSKFKLRDSRSSDTKKPKAKGKGRNKAAAPHKAPTQIILTDSEKKDKYAEFMPEMDTGFEELPENAFAEDEIDESGDDIPSADDELYEKDTQAEFDEDPKESIKDIKDKSSSKIIVLSGDAVENESSQE